MEFSRQTTDSTTASLSKQIIVSGVAANTVMYTVPKGRVFRGFITTTGNFRINTVLMQANAFFVGNGATSVPGGMSGKEITLVAESTILEGSSNSQTFIIGVEYDA